MDIRPPRAATPLAIASTHAACNVAIPYKSRQLCLFFGQIPA